MMPNNVDPLERLFIALTNLAKVSPTKLKSPRSQPRRASVAIIIRVRPPRTVGIDTTPELEVKNLHEFRSLPWVQQGEPEILYIKRAVREGDRWSGQVAFPGGKQDPEDIDDLDTVERETFEEVGLDLGNPKQFVYVGALDDREITTTFGKQLLMILCSFVFLQVTPEDLPLEISGSEVASTHWIPIAHLFDDTIIKTWDPVSIDISSSLAPKSWFLQHTLRTLTGRMHFHCIKLPYSTTSVDNNNNDSLNSTTTDRLDLWGLTLQMTSDLVDMMHTMDEDPPRLDGLLPKFDYVDVNLICYLLLRPTYHRRRLEFATQRRSRARGWSDYYSAVRKALLIAIFVRTIFAIWFLRELSQYLIGDV